MNEDFKFHLRSLTRFIYFVTDEEDRFLSQMQTSFVDIKVQTFVFNAAFGLQTIKNLTDDWKNRQHKEEKATTGINEALIQVYKDDPRDFQNYYVITDPDRYLADPQVVRRILNIAHQLHNDDRIIKVMIFVGPRLVIPQKLARYIEVVYDKGLPAAEIEETVTGICHKLTVQAPNDLAESFKGLTSYEIDAAIAQSIVLNRSIEGKSIREFKRRQLKKTDLITYVDVSNDDFSNVGGCDRFKEWARKTAANWTPEGKSFGLLPPKGVLLVGVWGCGKSISVKSLGNAWNVPVIQLEMGKLRQSGVGDSEANVYKIINLIESVSPCIVWVDEAEKSLSGGASSSASDSGTTSRMIGILSTWMQETKAPVCFAMTANSLKTLPTEFVNRMNERFFFDIPTEEERMAILKIHLKKRNQDPAKFPLADLAEAADNMVGREIEQAIEAGLTDSYDSYKKAKAAGQEVNTGLDPQILLKEVRIKPRIFKTMGDDIRELLDWVGFDTDAEEGIRAKFASSERARHYNQNKA